MARRRPNNNPHARRNLFRRQGLALALARLKALRENVTRGNLPASEALVRIGWVEGEIDAVLDLDREGAYVDYRGPFAAMGGTGCGCVPDIHTGPDPTCETCGGSGLITKREIAERVGLYDYTPEAERPKQEGT
jgi:hypothetical protein